jgi:hypothetical protein
VEASIFSAFNAQLLATPVLDFLTKAIEVLNRHEVTTSFGSWLVVHYGYSAAGMEKRSEGRHGWGEGVGRVTLL